MHKLKLRIQAMERNSGSSWPPLLVRFVDPAKPHAPVNRIEGEAGSSWSRGESQSEEEFVRGVLSAIKSSTGQVPVLFAHS